MGAAGHILVSVVTLLTARAVAQDLCDAVQCDPTDEPLCALGSDGSPALFPDLCVLQCTNCRLRAADVGVEYTLLNDSEDCENEAIYIRECPAEMNSDGDEDPTDGISILQFDSGIYEDGDDEELPSFSDDEMPFGLMSSFSDVLLERLLSSALSRSSAPEPPEGSFTYVDADVKVNVNININPTPQSAPSNPPPPPPQPPMPMLMAREVMPVSGPVRLEYWAPEEAVFSSGHRAAEATGVIVTAFSVLIAAVLHV